MFCSFFSPTSFNSKWTVYVACFVIFTKEECVRRPSGSHGLVSIVVSVFAEVRGHNSPTTDFFFSIHASIDCVIIPLQFWTPILKYIEIQWCSHRHAHTLNPKVYCFFVLFWVFLLCFILFFFKRQKNSQHSTDASAFDWVMPLYGNQ